jgi:CSLREA domain-containing protein
LKPISLLSCTAFILLALAAPAAAKTFHVDSQADEVDLSPGDGTCLAASGHCTLRAAVQEANGRPGLDTIRVPEGTYVLTRTGAGEDDAATGDLDLRGRVRVIGAGAGATVVDGKSSDRVFDVIGKARVVVGRLSIRKGSPPSPGRFGGGIRIADGARATVKGVVVSECTASNGGGILSSGRLKLLASMLLDNSASFGGGIFSTSDATIRASTFARNTAAGGTFQFAGSDLLAIGPAEVTIANTTSTGQLQTAAYCDPGIGCSDGADLLLANVTANEVSHATLGNATGSITLRNSIIAGCDGAVISQGYNFVAPEGCFIVGDLTGVVIGDDPLLSSLRDNGGPTLTRLPVAVSQAVDGGNPATPGTGGFACEPFDQRGVPRFLGMYCDIGAVEGN